MLEGLYSTAQDDSQTELGKYIQRTKAHTS